MIPPIIYVVNFARLLRMWMPIDLQVKSWMCWLTALISPLNDVYQNFLQFRKTKLYELSITPQVCYLEGMLNNRYDYTQRRIYIAEAKQFPPLYLYTDDELKPIYLYTDPEDQPVYLYTDAEGGIEADDFIIMVPAALIFNQDEMRSITTVYCLAGMKFKIQLF